MKKSLPPPSPANINPPRFGPDAPWLAPLAGYSDLPFRLLCREMGAATCMTEMISAKGLCYDGGATMDLLETCAEDSPLVIQLFGPEAESMAKAAAMLRKAGWLWFDCNLGCPARKVMRQGAGSALLADPENILAIAKAMLAALKNIDKDWINPDIQAKLGFKLRLGAKRGKSPLPDLALRLQDAGAAWLTLHPRYGSDGFSGHADWEEIARLKTLLDIPLLASGDLFSAKDGVACLKQTGADGVMYARGALKAPDIFQNHLDLLNQRPEIPQSREALAALILRHIEITRAFSTKSKAFYKMRSILPRYVRNIPGVGELRQKLCQCPNWDALINTVENFLANLPARIPSEDKSQG